MSREVLEMVERMDKKELKTQLALQCAPLLTGIKPSNLLTVTFGNAARGRAEAVEELFRDTDITVHTLCRTKHRAIFLLFRETELLAYLNEEEVKGAMRLYGYQTLRLIDIFEKLCARYQKYMKDRTSFPHELGLLLDILRRMFSDLFKTRTELLYSGYWKVYGDVKAAKTTFPRYSEARENVIRLVSSGMEITELLLYGRLLQTA